MNEKNGKPATDRPFYVLDRRLATFMDAADVIVTKPGGSTTAEIAYRGTPAVFDAVSGLFDWEHFTAKVFEERGRAVILSHASEISAAIERARGFKRSLELAIGPSGDILDPRVEVVKILEELVGTPQRCALMDLRPYGSAIRGQPCGLFPDDPVPLSALTPAKLMQHSSR